jgi:hypothetical protein
MSLLRKLLCRLDMHVYRDLCRGPFIGCTQQTYSQCLHCGRRQRIEWVSPLSGPRTMAMHPDAKD